jgi:hypothetical protein
MSDSRQASTAGRSAKVAPAERVPGADWGGMEAGQIGAAYGQAMLEMQRDWLVGMGRMQRDCLTFLGERMRKDIEIAKRIAECRDVKAAMELQTAFVETAREDYMVEAQKLFEMSQQVAESCAERLTRLPSQGNGGSSTG